MIVENAKHTGYSSLVNLDDIWMSSSASLVIFTFGSMKLLLIPTPVDKTAVNSKQTLAVGPEFVSSTFLS
jgi:hypothetical protein